MQYLFVVSYGGSGSALIQHVLNNIEGYTIRGENGGLLAPIVQSDLMLRRRRADVDRARTDSPAGRWFGADAIDLDAWRAERTRAFTQAVLTPPPGTLVAGFREVRYTPEEMDYPTFQAAMDFLADGFENARVVFNRRNPVQVARSPWWNGTEEGQVREYVTACNQRFADAHRRIGPDRSFVIDYEDYDCRPAGFLPLLDWLGESIAPDKLASICAATKDLPDAVPSAPEPTTVAWLDQRERRSVPGR